MVICEFYESDFVCVWGGGGIGVWLWFGAPIMQWVCRCIWVAILELLSQVVCCQSFMHWLVCKTRMICWLVVFRQWGAPLCCGVINLGLLSVGSHIWRGGRAMCLCHCWGIWCIWGLGVRGPKDVFYIVTHVLGRIGILEFVWYGRCICPWFSKSDWRVFYLVIW